MQNGITIGMKTAISVEDTLMAEADGAARDLGVSRSALITEALRDYLRRRRQAQISEQLNRVYANEPELSERQTVRKFKTKLPNLDRW
jgi:metal-responsive CopG/Arc/MetJ family transcriptional regulator